MYNLQPGTVIRAAEAGGVSKAAEDMHISTPAAIKQINLLEHSLDVKDGFLLIGRSSAKDDRVPST